MKTVNMLERQQSAPSWWKGGKKSQAVILPLLWPSCSTEFLKILKSWQGSVQSVGTRHYCPGSLVRIRPSRALFWEGSELYMYDNSGRQVTGWEFCRTCVLWTYVSCWCPSCVSRGGAGMDNILPTTLLCTQGLLSHSRWQGCILWYAPYDPFLSIAAAKYVLFPL